MLKSFLLVAAITLLSSNAAFKIEPRIYRGNPSAAHQFPFFAYLEVVEPWDTAGLPTIKVCGGSLINEEWILTTAYCLEKADYIGISMGPFYKYANTTERQHFSAHQADYILHPQYDSITMQNDIALIRLPKRANFTEHIQPVKLSSDKFKLEDVILVGHGKTGNDAYHVSDILQYADMYTIEQKGCFKHFPLWTTGFCAKNDLGRSMCVGDGGSGLIRKSDGKLVGLASAHKEDCEAGSPQAFTNIALYHSWLTKVTGIDFTKA